MRIGVSIDETLIAEAMRLSGVQTQRDAIELGLRTLVQIGHQREIRRLRGCLGWSGNLDLSRAGA
jgi:Arc/MetJ family transcription regulator